MSQDRRSARSIVWLATRALFGAVIGATLGFATAGAQEADHPLLYRIMAQTRGSPETYGSPYIQIVNPTTVPVLMGDVYLSNGNFAQSDLFYYHLVDAPESAGGGASDYFHVRFPDNFELAGQDTVIIAINGSGEFETAYGRVPDFELYEEGQAPDTVPEMVPAFPGAVGAGLNDPGSNTPALGVNNLCLVLYRWDGASDRVQDLDYLIWGADTRFRVDKSGYASDGPDADSNGTAYNDDTPAAAQIAAAGAAPTFGRTLARFDAVEADETQLGGNGLLDGDVGGNDETSENLAATWHLLTQDDPPAQTAPAVSPAPIVTSASLQPSPPIENAPLQFSATVVASDGVAAVDFYYAVDGGRYQVLSAVAGANDSWSATVDAPAAGAEIGWYLRARGGEGGTVIWPYGSPRFEFRVTVVAMGSGPAKLLISEVCTKGSDEEFIEIYNPNNFAVDMSDYYLTDAVYGPADQYYWRIAEGDPQQSTVGGGAFADFHARFPADFEIAGGDTIVVAVAGADRFVSSFNYLPTIELYEDGVVGALVPDMRPIFGDPDGANSIIDRAGDSLPTLSNGGEIVVLYHWDGEADLVTDIDVFVWGTSTSYRFSKTGVTVGGSTYRDETAVGNQRPYAAEPDFGDSYTRVDFNEGDQITSGSNGVGGRDEVSEGWATTFEPRPYSPARPPEGGEAGGNEIALKVPAKTFDPRRGEVLPVEITTAAQSETKVRIFDLEGRLVIKLYDSRFDGAAPTIPGQFRTLAWDGRNATFERVPAGLYIVHLSVVNEASGEERTATAPAVVASRLKD